MPVELIKSVIDDLACPEGKREAMFFDKKLPGFGLRVNSKGQKTFLVQYNRRGAVKRVILGRMGVITAAEARRKAMELIGVVQAGGDPVEARRLALEAEAVKKSEAARRAAAQRQADEFTVSRLVESWASIKLRDKSASYRAEGPRSIKRLLGELADEPAASITTAKLQVIIDQEIDRAPALTIDARASGRAAWNWAMKRGLVASNPFADVVIERRIASRDRVLTDAELGAVWRAACDQPYPFGPAVQLMILTLQRLSEVTGMAWSELAPDFSKWTIPAVRAKNRRAHVVHLSDPAREILQHLHARRRAVAATARIRRATDAGAHTAGQEAAEPDIDLILTVTGVTPVSGVGKARRALDPVKKQPDGTDAAVLAPALAQAATKERAPKVERERADWRFHDFRRTGVSKMAELGIPPHVADRVLNHVSGAISGVAAVYQRFEFLPERARALDVWAAHVLALGVSEGKGLNVLSMPNALDRLKDGTS